VRKAAVTIWVLSKTPPQALLARSRAGLEYNILMAKKSSARRSTAVPVQVEFIPRSAICRFARALAEKFQPDRIILFGSYAYGTPHANSDVDMLVVMPTRDTFNQAVNIRMAIDYHFSLDLLVRTPKELAQRLKLGDPFMREIVSKGKILYEKADVGMGSKSRSRHDRSTKAPTVRTPRS